MRHTHSPTHISLYTLRGLRNQYVHKLLFNWEIAYAMWSSLIGLAYVTESAFAMGPVHLVTGPIAHSYRRTEPCCLYNYVRQGCLQHCNMPPHTYTHTHTHFKTTHFNIIHCTFWYTHRTYREAIGWKRNCILWSGLYKLLRHQVLKSTHCSSKFWLSFGVSRSKLWEHFSEVAGYVPYLPVFTCSYWLFPACY